jgi:hypothetical protein
MSDFRAIGDGPIIQLYIGADRISLEVLSDVNGYNLATLEAGSLRSILEHLHHEPATSDELEAAISEIEDALMPAIRSLPERRLLVTSAPEVWEVVRGAGLSGSPEVNLDIATVEQLFNRLADVAFGAPAAQLGIPSNRAFAATLLILREVLHHGGFDSIIVMESLPTANNLL